MKLTSSVSASSDAFRGNEAALDVACEASAPGVRFWVALLTVFLGFVPAGVVSQEAAQEAELSRMFGYAEQVPLCWDERGGRHENACIGAAWEVCDATETGKTTFETLLCIRAEIEGWEQVLDTVYLDLLNTMSDWDASEPPGRVDLDRVGALMSAQSAWENWRDAECFFQYAKWQAGTIRDVENLDCLARLTAKRAIELADGQGLRP